MSPEQENIIKDKLLDYEVPFEEKYWKDFQKRAKEVNGKKNNHRKYYGLALLALLSFSFFAINKNINKKSAVADNQKNDIVNTITSDKSIKNVAPTDNNKSNTKSSINNIEQTNSKKSISTSNNLENTINQNINNSKSSNSDKQAISTIQNNNLKDRSRSQKDQTNVQIIEIKKNLNNKSHDISIESSFNAPSSEEAIIASTNNQTIHSVKNTAHNAPTNDITPINLSSQTSISDINQVINNNSSTSNLDFSTIQSGKTNIGSNNIVNQFNASSLSPSDVLNKKAENTSLNSSAIEQRINNLVQLDAIGYLPPSESNLNNLEKGNATQASEDVNWEVEKSKDWEIGVYAGIGLNIPTHKRTELESTYNINGGGPNITAGAYFNYFIGKKISLETGFKYKKISNHFSAGYSLTNDVDLIKIEEVSIVQNLQSFEIPMGINYRVSYWLNLSTGVSMAYVKPTNVFTDLQVENPMNNPNIDDYKYLDQFDNYGIRKFDIRVYAGLTFNVSSFVSFRMLMNQGLLDRTNNDYYNSNQYNVHTDYSFSAILRLNRKALK